MMVGSLFAGIGGFDLGLERAGFTIAWQVENDPFCQKVLAKHWPHVKRYGDIRNVKNPATVDLICGGWPCQPFSCAGQRKGETDDRYLWPEMFRIIQETKPTWIIGENVAGFISMGLDDCVSDLEGAGYEVQPLIIPACAVGAPHRRDRVCGLLPTPQTQGLKVCDENGKTQFFKFPALLPTPKGSAAGPDYAKLDRSKTGISLPTALGLVPIPAARDWKGANGPAHMTRQRPHMDQLPNVVTHGLNRGLKLQPAFVEWLMGFPEGWTELND